MKLTDSSGKILIEEKGDLFSGMNSFSLRKADSMLPGIYFMQVISGDGKIYTNKLILNAP